MHEDKQLRQYLPLGASRWRAEAPQIYSEDAGEAATGSGGDQPDRGIAGRNSSPGDGQGVLLPSRAIARQRGRPTGAASGPDLSEVTGVR